MKVKADTLFYGGKIYTMEAPGVCKEAVVLKDGKFAYVGTKEEALERFDCAKCIDLQGKTVLPGMGDSHLHFFAFCQTYTTVDLGGATSRAEALQLPRHAALGQSPERSEGARVPSRAAEAPPSPQARCAPAHRRRRTRTLAHRVPRRSVCG